MNGAPQVDFYLLAGSDLAQRAQFACRLAEKAFRLGHRIHIHTDDEAAAVELDALLWQFQPTAFVPHTIGADAASDVIIDWRAPTSDDGDLLINLTLTVPPFFAAFQRVAEIVVDSDALQRALRSNFRHYRDRGLTLATHDLRQPK
jgi:DNA polymerase-3 subunit chi